MGTNRPFGAIISLWNQKMPLKLERACLALGENADNIQMLAVKSEKKHPQVGSGNCNQSRIVKCLPPHQVIYVSAKT